MSGEVIVWLESRGCIVKMLGREVILWQDRIGFQRMYGSL